MTYADREMQLQRAFSSRVFLLCEMKIPENQLRISPAARRSTSREYRCSGPRGTRPSGAYMRLQLNPGYAARASAVPEQRRSSGPGSDPFSRTYKRQKILDYYVKRGFSAERISTNMLSTGRDVQPAPPGGTPVAIGETTMETNTETTNATPTPAPKKAAKKSAAAKPAAKSTAKLVKKAPTDGTPLKTICAKLKIEPRLARRKLRAADLAFHGKRERWVFTPAQAAKATEILRA